MKRSKKPTVRLGEVYSFNNGVNFCGTTEEDASRAPLQGTDLVYADKLSSLGNAITGVMATLWAKREGLALAFHRHGAFGGRFYTVDEQCATPGQRTDGGCDGCRYNTSDGTPVKIGEAATD